MKQSFFNSKLAIVGLCVAFSSVATGCRNAGQRVAIGGNTNNPANLTSQDDFETRAKKITLGMTKEQAFAASGIDEKLFTVLPTDEAMTVVFGKAVPQPSTDDEMRKIAFTVEQFEVFTLPFTQIKKFGAIDWKGETEETRIGFDRKLTVVVENGLIRRAFITGSPTVENTSRQNAIWEAGPKVAGQVLGFN